MAHILKQNQEVFNLIYEKSGKVIYDLLNHIALANWNKNAEREYALTEELADMLASTSAYSDMLGRRRVLLRADNIKLFNDEPEEVNPIIPNTPFQEAIDDMVKRMPILANSAEEVRRIYSVSNYFSVAKSASLKLTERIQSELAKAMQQGTPITKSADIISKISGFSYHYANNIYRTNLNTSYHAGQFQILKDPDIEEILPAFKFIAVGDSDTRPNHLAMNGIIASVRSQIWSRYSAPLGYQCRCSLITMDARTLKRMGYDPYRIPDPAIPATAFPDSPNFGHKPSSMVYGD